jgi:uncharacterized protein (TIGR02145 family)
MGLFFGQNRSFDSLIPSIVTSNIKYGRLYNWYAASNVNFAPVEWHVPVIAEFELLVNIYGGSGGAGEELKEIGLIYWDAPNSNSTNISNFNGRGSGYRNVDGSFSDLKVKFQAFSLTDIDGSKITQTLNKDSETAGQGEFQRKNGASIRFVRNATAEELSLTNGVFCSNYIDLDGNIYRTVKIGTQVWLADNWACTKLNDSTPIPNVTLDASWSVLTTGAYCNYNNDIINVFL